jgi:hypothetical protein
VSRPVRLALIGLAVLAFLVVSALLARVLSANGAERTAVTALVEAEARGDGAGVSERLSSCAAGTRCAAEARAIAARVRRPGRVEILTYIPAARFSLGGSRGVARVAWRVAGGRPVAQCVVVRRTGDPIAGLGVVLDRLSEPLGREACPPGF